MKIQCLVSNLKNAVFAAERVTSKNQTLPILGSIFITTEREKIKIRATNLESALEIDLAGKISESGSLAVPARALAMFIAGISDEQISLESQKNSLFIKTPKTQTLIRGYSPEDFPLFPKIETTHKFELPSAEFKHSILSVLPAVSVSDIKPEIASVYLNIFKNNIKFAATDSFRLAEKKLVSKNNYSDKQVSFLVPQKTLIELIKLLNEEDKNINIGVNKNQITISAGNFRFISRLTEGNFPDYDQIVPKEFKTTAVFKKADFLPHLKLAGVFSSKLNDILIDFQPDKKIVALSTNHKESGEHVSYVDSQIDGPAVSLKFNWKYLLDGASQINHEYIVFYANNEQSPLLIKGKNDPSYFYLAMPMRGV